jgi:hypothetical protein
VRVSAEPVLGWGFATSWWPPLQAHWLKVCRLIGMASGVEDKQRGLSPRYNAEW